VRERFTLAHELGHILIPWHIGTVLVSHIDDGGASTSSEYREMEAEANRFAAELLLPTEWVRERIDGATSVSEMYERLEEAEVSRPVASFQICRAAPAGLFFIEMTPFGRVVSAAASGGTRIRLPSKGVKYVSPRIPGASVEEIQGPMSKIIWWRFEPQALTPPTPIDRDWRPVLQQILSETLSTLGERESARMSNAGIVGSANARASSVDETFARCFQRVASDPDLARVASHPLFPMFLSMRVADVISRRKHPT
jgi:hypothetical protein